MITYEEKVIKELEQWKATFMKDSSMMTRFSKKVQTKVQRLIPAKVQKVLTETIRMMVQTISAGSNFIKPKLKEMNWSLQRRDDEVRKKMDEYKKIARQKERGREQAVFSLALLTFRCCSALKLNFYSMQATLYGFDTSDKEERLFYPSRFPTCLFK
ncbi:EcsC family protein [Bacillus paranthracis]